MQLKQRTLGASSQAIAKQPSTDSEQNVADLKLRLEHLIRHHKIAVDASLRFKDLLGRKSAKVLSPKKLARMVRRLTSAEKIENQLDDMIDQLNFKLNNVDVAQ